MLDGVLAKHYEGARTLYESGWDPELGEIEEGQIKLSQQQADVLLSETPITLAIAGIRGGKTHVGAVKTLLYGIQHACDEDEVHLICSPTYQMSKVPTEKIFKLLYDKTMFPICPLIKYKRSERMFILAAPGGKVSRLVVRSLHDPDRLRGIKAKSAWLDEGAYITTYAWDVVLGRVADTAGPIWITTTPDGYNWCYELYDQARQGDPEITVVHWESTQNQFANQEGITRLIRRYDERTYKQEVGARFVRGRGIVYYTFSRQRHGLASTWNRDLDVWVGQDFNVDPMATVISQPFRTAEGQEGIHVKYARKARDSSTFALVAFLDRFVSEHNLQKHKVTVYADAAGNNRSTSGKSDFRILKDSKYTVAAPRSNPQIKDRVNCVNGLFAPMDSKYPRIMIDIENAGPLVEDLEKQIWSPHSDPPTPDKSAGHDHLPDALGYKCWKRYPLKSSTSLPKAA